MSTLRSILAPASVRYLLALAALGLLACNIPARTRVPWEEPRPGLFTTGPYILLGEPGEAFVALKAKLPSAPTVEWWVESNAERLLATRGISTPATETAEPARVTTVEARRVNGLWVAHLVNLPIGPHLAYRVRSARGNTETSWFRVGVPRDERFRFAVFGDTRTGHRVHRAVSEAVAREQVEFFLHTGDMVHRGGIDQQWDQFFQIERPLLAKAPILPAIGNHDISGRGNFRRYFLHRLWAKNRRYFHHDWGNLRVVAVDAGIECRRGCTQFSYAARALEEGADRGMLLVMLLHYPPYSSGKHGSALDIRKPVTDLAAEYGVELIFAGHDHNYERTKPIGGTTYVVSGSAGAPIRPVRPQVFTAAARTEPHYVLIDVENDRLTLRAINLRGDTFDEIVIPANPPRHL